MKKKLVHTLLISARLSTLSATASGCFFSGDDIILLGGRLACMVEKSTSSLAVEMVVWSEDGKLEARARRKAVVFEMGGRGAWVDWTGWV